jgi:hypothetical protein
MNNRVRLNIVERGIGSFVNRKFHIYLYSVLLLILSVIVVGFRSAEENQQMKMLGYIETKRSTEIKNSPWAIQAGTLDDTIVKKASDIGVKWTRLQAVWSDIEREPGIFNWEKTDKAFSVILAQGITPFVTIEGTNSIYVKTKRTLDPKLAELYGTRPHPPTSNPAAMKAWLCFVENVIERYKEKIKYWEIWNEPNHFNYWGDEPNGKEYGRLLHESAKKIKRIDPQAFVLGGAMAGLDPVFTDDFLSVGNERLVDIITFHNYGIIPEERIYLAEKVWDVINKYNPNIKLWQGECGVASHSSTIGFRGFSPWGPIIQAKWLLRQSFTDTYFCRATVSSYFKLFDPYRTGEKPKRSFLSKIDSVLGFPERGGYSVKLLVGINEKCLLDAQTLKPKPGFYAYQNLCALMDSRYSPSVVKHEITVNNEGIFYGIGPEDDAFPSVPLVASYKTEKGKYLLAYWLPWHPQEIIEAATIDLKLKEIKFQNPVLVDLLDGKVYQINQHSQDGNDFIIKNIPLADYPYVILERDEIKLK